MNDYRFLFKLYRPYYGWLLAGTMLAVIAALSSIALLTLSGWFICSCAVAGALAPDGVAVSFNFLQPAAQIRALAILRTLGRYTERLITHEATFRVLADLRSWFFCSMIPIKQEKLAWQRGGDMLSRITSDIDVLDGLYLRILTPAAVAAICSFLVLLLIADFSESTALVMLLIVLLAGVVFPYVFSFFCERPARQEVKLLADLKLRQVELVQGLAELLAFQVYPVFRQRLLSVSDRLIQVQRDNDRLSALSGALTAFLAQTAWLLCLILLGSQQQTTQLSGPELAMLVFALMALFEWINNLAQGVLSHGKVRQAAVRIRELAQTGVEIDYNQSNDDMPLGYALELQNISYRYSTSQGWVLRELNLHIPEGRKIGIIGSSGIGKSTLLHLLLRYFDPELGRISLGGKDLRRFSSKELISYVSLLTQRSHLFSGTIRDNLLFGKPDATEAELLEASRQAGLSTLLQRLPAGLDSLVGEYGAQVSGGEARRIALARVYLKNSPILLLDEPTEGLDASTEHDVLQLLEEFSQDKSVILVTHRNSGLELVQQVYDLQEGKLNEQP